MNLGVDLTGYTADELAPLEAWAEIALSRERPVVPTDCGLILVPDVFVLEAEANGKVIPPTCCLERESDGREVYVFPLPEAAR